MVRRFDENPKDFPKYRSTSIIPAIIIPETYQGQGCWMISNI